jgi:hypothetical protein
MLRRCVQLVRLYSTLSQSSAVGNLLSHITRVQPNHPDNHVEYALWLQEEGKEMNLIFTQKMQLKLIK